MICVPNLHCGGAERNTVTLCERLDPEMFDVVLLVLDNRTPFYTLSRQDVRIIDLKQRKASLALPGIRREVLRFRPQILLSMSNHLNLLLAMFRSRFPAGMKLVARESSVVSINSRRAAFPSLFRFLLKRFYRRIDVIVCQSAFMQRDLISFCGVPEPQTRVIRNAVRVPEAQLTTQLLGLYRTQIITVSRLSEEKGVDRVLRALLLVNRGFDFHIIGDGPHRKVLESQVRRSIRYEHTRFHGASDKPFEVVRNPTLFLCGSQYEGSPNAVIEALSLGIPVVAFDAPGGLSELIRNGENGFLVPDGDEEAFARMVEKALDHPFSRDGIAETTRAVHDPAVIAGQWRDFLRSLMP